MSDIRRLHVAKRYSEVSIYKGLIHLAGQVCRDAPEDIVGQTKAILAQVDKLLNEAGSDKTRILFCQVFMADLADFEGFNQVWDSWVAKDLAPPRATIQAKLPCPTWRVELVITAVAY